MRPVVSNGYEREFVYAYGAVSPLEGELDWQLYREMNTVRRGEFLTRVSRVHPAGPIRQEIRDSAPPIERFIAAATLRPAPDSTRRAP